MCNQRSVLRTIWRIVDAGGLMAFWVSFGSSGADGTTTAEGRDQTLIPLLGGQIFFTEPEPRSEKAQNVAPLRYNRFSRYIR